MLGFTTVKDDWWLLVGWNLFSTHKVLLMTTSHETIHPTNRNLGEDSVQRSLRRHAVPSFATLGFYPLSYGGRNQRHQDQLSLGRAQKNTVGCFHDLQLDRQWRVWNQRGPLHLAFQLWMPGITLYPLRYWRPERLKFGSVCCLIRQVRQSKELEADCLWSLWHDSSYQIVATSALRALDIGRGNPHCGGWYKINAIPSLSGEELSIYGSITPSSICIHLILWPLFLWLLWLIHKKGSSGSWKSPKTPLFLVYDSTFYQHLQHESVEATGAASTDMYTKG
jgi:hypothetical protein